MKDKNSKSQETVALLKRIREGSTSSEVSLGEILRLCMRLGKQLNNEELVTWARMEASGYTDAEDLPDYRKLPSESRGTFFGPFGSGIKNAHIPSNLIEKDHKEILCNVYVFEPVNELEDLARGGSGKSNLLELPWPSNFIAYYQRKEIYENNLVLASAWRVMTKQKLLGILETVRTRVLDFVLQIEETLGLDSEVSDEDTKITQPQPKEIQQVFNNTIYGGNVALGNSGDVNQQTINVQKGDFDSLRLYMEQLGIKKADINTLEQAISEDKNPTNGLGPAVSKWLAKATALGLKGSLSVASNVAGSLLASALMRYYGIHG